MGYNKEDNNKNTRDSYRDNIGVGQAHPLGMPVETVIRLRDDVYRELEAKLSACIVVPSTTELQAGFILGQQSVLKMLREGYVISSSIT